MSNCSPTRAEFANRYREGQLTFVYREVVADGLTPVSTYARLGRGPYSFLLESAAGSDKWAAHSIVGVQPRQVFRARGREVEIFQCVGPNQVLLERRLEKDPLAALQALLTELPVLVPDGLPPFFGGAVGWLSYDAVRWFEHLPNTGPDELELPDACFVLTDTAVVFNNLRGTIKVVAAVPGTDGDANRAYDEASARVDAIVDRLRAPGGVPLPPLDITPTEADVFREAQPRTTQEAYEAGVRKIQEYVRAGDAFQVVLSQRFDLARQGIDPFDVYRILRATNPSPYMFHFEFPEAVVTGASPECLARKQGEALELHPIAGTRRRGRTETEDVALELELLHDEKERAEHVMLIDLGRNDLGRVAEPGSVRVENMMSIERYSHVMHLVSRVTAKLARSMDAFDVVRAVFPAGTLSGAPKIRAMQIVEELEPCHRGIYGGGVGYFSYSGNLDLAIAIRTLVTRRDTMHVQAGAGIVADSRAEAEHQECMAKARVVLQAVELARRSQRLHGGPALQSGAVQVGSTGRR